MVERLDVLQLVDILEALGVDQTFGQRVKHERVVGIGTMGDVNLHGECWRVKV